MIYETTDYSKFKTLERNRRISGKDVLESIQEKNMLHLHPIIVDKYMNVIDGQHRLNAAKILNLPIFYVIDENISEEDIPRQQIQKRWVLEDYLNFYLNTKQDYKTVKEIYDATKINLGVIIEQIGKSRRPTFTFKNGLFEIKDKTINFVKIFMEIEYTRKQLFNISKTTHRGLTRQLYKLFNIKGFNFDHFATKAMANKDMVEDIKEYRCEMRIFQKLVDLYNFRTGEKSRLNV